ncbi:MAG: Na+/H+ antiporter NhaC family protein, partial [Planctomycetaceae bacterium]
MLQGIAKLRTVFAAVAIAGTTALTPAATRARGDDESPRIRIAAPPYALIGVPVASVQIEVLDEHGIRDANFNGRVNVAGVDVIAGRGDPNADSSDVSCDAGLLRLETNRSIGRKVYIADEVIRVTLPDGRAASHSVRRLPGWLSLLPALVAVGMAVALRETLVALFTAVWVGLTLMTDAGDGFLRRIASGFLEAVDAGLVGQLVPADADTAHVQIILFTLFLGCLVGVMSASGGTEALVARLTPVTRTRRGGQVTTFVMGLVVFFDDYANSLLLGGTMRPVTDRLRISREKLAFLVDSTAAPVAGLALVSTWVGFEVGLIGDSFSRLAEQDAAITYSGDAYGTFLATWPYRFYPLLVLVFVLMIAWTGRDFGPMRRAERRAIESKPRTTGSAKPQASMGIDRPFGTQAGSAAVGTMWNAIVPLVVLLGGIVLGFWVTGRANVEIVSPSLWEIISNAESNRVLLTSSFLASIAAVLMALATRSLSPAAAVAAWLEGAKSMVLGCAILVLAWAVAMVCDADHLNTAGYLVEVTTGRLDIAWMPAVAFLLSAAISFATGSSWATMGLLIPLVVSVTFGLMAGDPSLASAVALDRQPLMLASVGGVLAGSIFGDHCSPISDTTVLSSVASDCDHLAHVATQFPYALCVGLVAL